MGKTYRKVNAGSCSIDYHSPHNRGFAKDVKARSHHSIRTHNKGCNEDNIQTFNCKHKHMNTHWAASYYGKPLNLPNYKGIKLDKKNLYEDFNYKWSKEDTTQLDTMNTIVETNKKHHNIDYIRASKKQIERRGNVGSFRSHR
jgi:hypothetical protein